MSIPKIAEAHLLKAETASTRARDMFESHAFDQAITLAADSATHFAKAAVSAMWLPNDPRDLSACVKTMSSDGRLPKKTDALFESIRQARTRHVEGPAPANERQAEDAQLDAARLGYTVRSAMGMPGYDAKIDPTPAMRSLDDFDPCY